MIYMEVKFTYTSYEETPSKNNTQEMILVLSNSKS